MTFSSSDETANVVMVELSSERTVLVRAVSIWSGGTSPATKLGQ